MIIPLAVANLFCLVLGYLYPAYASFKTLDAPYEKEQFRRWLVYWVVISAFSAVELLGDSILFWLPFYYEAKMAFIAWLVLPYFKGSVTIYHKYIEPVLEKYNGQIDTHVDKARSVVQSALGRVGTTAMKHIRSQSVSIINNLTTAEAAAAAAETVSDGAKSTEGQQDTNASSPE
mmetsp:Transcript_37220/g.54821  ORF Transcript_37220/g.54821 Transcript_37220/m.54821 type:complete len:175 (-) Transcript_37220:182-706(-)